MADTESHDPTREGEGGKKCTLIIWSTGGNPIGSTDDGDDFRVIPRVEIPLSLKSMSTIEVAMGASAFILRFGRVGDGLFGRKTTMDAEEVADRLAKMREEMVRIPSFGNVFDETRVVKPRAHFQNVGVLITSPVKEDAFITTDNEIRSHSEFKSSRRFRHPAFIKQSKKHHERRGGKTNNHRRVGKNGR